MPTNVTSSHIKEWTLKAFLLLCPVFYMCNETNLRSSQELFFKVMGMALICLFWENFWLSAFLILNILLLFYNGYTVGADYVLNVFIGGCIFWVSRLYFQKNSFLPYRKVFLIIFFVDLLWMGLQHFNIDPLYTGVDHLNRVDPGLFNYNTGIFNLKAINAIFLALMIPILMSFNAFLAIPVFFLLFLCRSSGGMLAGIAAFLFVLYFKSKKLFIAAILLGVMGAGGFLYFDNKDDHQTFNSRFSMWHQAVRLSFQNPIGYGPDSFRNYNAHKDFLFAADAHYRNGIIKKDKDGTLNFHYYGINGKYPDVMKDADFDENMKTINIQKVPMWDNSHNEYIQLFFENGIFGVLILIGLFREVILLFKKTTKDKEAVILFSILIVFAVSSVVQFPNHLARIGCFLPVVLGAFYAITKKEVSYA